MSDLRSAPLPPPGPDDHLIGPPDAPLVVTYADFECPFCASLAVVLGDAPVPVLLLFRHFPVRSSHARAWPAACASEAAALQGRFWEMHDLLFSDQGRLEDPHLWAWAESLGLDMDRFDVDRRSEAVRARVRRDFRSGVRAGVVSTPTAFMDAQIFVGRGGISAIKTLLGM